MFEGLFQPVHLIIVLGIVILIFGPKKLPELGKGLAEGIRGFKKGLNDISSNPAESSTERRESEIPKTSREDVKDVK